MFFVDTRLNSFPILVIYIITVHVRDSDMRCITK